MFTKKETDLLRTVCTVKEEIARLEKLLVYKDEDKKEVDHNKQARELVTEKGVLQENGNRDADFVMADGTARTAITYLQAEVQGPVAVKFLKDKGRNDLIKESTTKENLKKVVGEEEMGTLGLVASTWRLKFTKKD